MRPIDTSALSVAAQQGLQQIPAELASAPLSSADLAAELFGGDRVDLSPAAQALIGGESDNEKIVTDTAHAIGLADWPPAT
jgi:hypothetical protein